MVVGFKATDTLTTQQKLIAGMVSGVTTRFISQPLDIVKVRIQLHSRAKKRYKNFIHLSYQMLKEEGAMAFWHGHCLGQIHSVLSISSQFQVYDWSTRYVQQEVPSSQPSLRSALLFLCGVFAGCASATLVSPLEVIRVRQMLVKAQYGGMWQGARTVYKGGGLKAFYEGLPASLAQMGPQVGITFAVFTILEPLIIDYLTLRSSGENGNARDEILQSHVIMAATAASAVAGFVSKTVTYPFDLAKRRLQIASHTLDPTVKTPTMSQHVVKCRNLIDCLVFMYEKGGLRGLFRGWGVTIYKSQLNAVVSFTTYEMVCHALRQQNEIDKNKKS